METIAAEAPLACEALVVGAGHAGLAAAIGLADSGVDTILCGTPERQDNGRTVALLDGSVRLLKALGVWAGIEPLASPLCGLRLIDDTGSLWSAPPLEFRAGEIGLEAFGWNVENSDLVATLAAGARNRARLRLIETRVEACDFAENHAVARAGSGVTIGCDLVVAADGRASPLRKLGGIEVSDAPYPQTAITVILSHSRPHLDISTEFQRTEGPFTLVPLPGKPTAPFRSSLVWVMANPAARRRAALDDAALAREIESQARSMLGAMTIESPRGIFPIGLRLARAMTAPRLALIGDAAHALPPIGAQGLNLGLRDGAHLVEAVSEARRMGERIGSADTLSRYAGLRRFDVALRAGAVDGLNRSLLARSPPINALRGAGLAALGAIGPLRRLVMREGVAPRFGSTAAMRDRTPARAR